MTSPAPSAPATRSAGIGWPAFLGSAALVYLVGLGGTAVGELIPAIFVVNAVIAGFLVVAYIRGAHRADRIDSAVVVALLLVLAACLFSAFPRRSFDSALLLLTCAAGFFIARGLVARDRTREWIIRVLIGLSAAMTLVAAGRWGVIVAQWMSIAGAGILPPLNLELPAAPWGHRHDLALLVAVLYPAWWTGRPSRPRRGLAFVVGALVVFVVIIDGSRTLWAALVAASAIVMGRPLVDWWRMTSRRLRIAVLAAAVGVGLVLLATGVAVALLQRATNLYSLGFRGEMWASLIDSWIGHPILGSGPGSFPWILQGTGYFDTNSLAPRHPDSAPIQLMAEAGLLGIAALGLVLVAIVPAVARSTARGAAWALLAFAIASLASNPSDFPFMAAVVIVWAAIAVPRAATDERFVGGGSRLARRASFGAAAVIAAAYFATVAAAAAYSDGRAEFSDGDLAAAMSSLDRAAQLDPGMAIYPRMRGVVHLAMDDLSGAVADFSRTTRLNPHDHVAWRSLAAAHRARGDLASADEALANALRVMRADPTALLMWAEFSAAAGRRDQALAAIAEVVNAWPEVTGADGWDLYLARVGVDGEDAVAAAARRWELGQPFPDTVADQGVWLAVLADRDDLLPSALQVSGLPDSLHEPIVSSLRCQSVTADLDQSTAGAVRTPAYWALRLRNSGLHDAPDPDARWMLQLATGEQLADPTLREAAFSPSRVDVWGYRRLPPPTLGHLADIPSPDSGLARWYLDPKSAGSAAGVDSCQD